MSGFSNSILGGAETLIRKAIRSRNFMTGLAGFSINKDGSAEFNSITLRGTFRGNHYVINNTGTFFYSGVPAFGNLILSDTDVQGTDDQGNAFLPGTVNYTNNAGAFTAVQLINGTIAISTATSAAGPWASRAEMFYEPTAPAGLYLQSAASPGETLIVLDAGGAILQTGFFTGTNPATGLPESWHPIPLTNGWTNTGTGFPAAQYRLLASPPSTVEAVGHISHASTSGSSVISITLGPGYTPARTLDEPVVDISTSPPAATSPASLSLNTSGILTLANLGAGTTQAIFHCFFPLDA